MGCDANHVHVLATPLPGNSLSSILHLWKSFTVKEANRCLGRSGAFWLEEYFDRAIRDETHFNKVVEYIELTIQSRRDCVKSLRIGCGAVLATGKKSVKKCSSARAPRMRFH